MKQEKALIDLLNKMPFLRDLDNLPDMEGLEKIFSENPKILTVIEKIIPGPTIKREELDNLTNNEAIYFLLESYCIINKIDIEEEIEEKSVDEVWYRNSADADSVKAYYNDIARFAMLTPEEEIEVARAAKEKDAEALHKLVNSNLRLVVSIAKKFINRNVPFLDLIQEGNLGLIRAAEKFDVDRGLHFSTFATWWIRQTISRAIPYQGRNIRLSVDAYEKVTKVKMATNELQRSLNREPNPEELAQYIGISIETVVNILNIITDTISLNSMISRGDETDTEYMDMISDDLNVQDDIERKLVVERLKEIYLSINLTEQQRTILAYRFNSDQEITLQELANMYNITRERVRQIENNALKKIRDSKYGRELKEIMGIKNDESNEPVVTFNVSIKDFFNKYSLEEIEKAIGLLNQTQIKAIYYYFGPNLDQRNFGEDPETQRIVNTLISYISRKLKLLFPYKSHETVKEFSNVSIVPTSKSFRSTVFEMFPNNDQEIILRAIELLNEKAQAALKQRFGDDYMQGYRQLYNNAYSKDLNKFILGYVRHALQKNISLVENFRFYADLNGREKADQLCATLKDYFHRSKVLISVLYDENNVFAINVLFNTLMIQEVEEKISENLKIYLSAFFDERIPISIRCKRCNKPTEVIPNSKALVLTKQNNNII